MGMTRHLGASATHQEVEITALVGLQHMIDIQLTVPTSPVRMNIDVPAHSYPFGQLVIADIEVQAPRRAPALDYARARARPQKYSHTF